jgi:acetyltransferase-like isoleucine patch superfamily enzyme
VFEAREGTILIGSGTRFNEQVFLGADFGSIEIGADVIVGMNVVARASDHRFDRTPEILIRLQGHNAGSIVVGDDVWIGANVTLLPGTKIGDHSVIGAGAVVNGEIPALSLAVGAPARVIKKLGEDVEAARGEFKGAQPRDSGGATDEQS